MTDIKCDFAVVVPIAHGSRIDDIAASAAATIREILSVPGLTLNITESLDTVKATGSFETHALLPMANALSAVDWLGCEMAKRHGLKLGFNITSERFHNLFSAQFTVMMAVKPGDEAGLITQLKAPFDTLEGTLCVIDEPGQVSLLGRLSTPLTRSAMHALVEAFSALTKMGVTVVARAQDLKTFIEQREAFIALPWLLAYPNDPAEYIRAINATSKSPTTVTKEHIAFWRQRLFHLPLLYPMLSLNLERGMELVGLYTNVGYVLPPLDGATDEDDDTEEGEAA